jgi:hypothetical protein
VLGDLARAHFPLAQELENAATGRVCEGFVDFGHGLFICYFGK